MPSRSALPAAATARIPSLDGLRALSIGLVLISHLIMLRDFPLRPADVDRWADALGAFGVRVFFVLSGFLITSLLLDELRRRGRIHLARFYFRRSLRIFIPYYAFLGVLLVFGGLDLVALRPADVLHAATYTMNYFPERAWPLGHSWSLSVEEQFYILWPAALLLGRRQGLWLAGAMLVLAPVMRLAVFYFAPELVRYEAGYRFETVADALATGCLLAGCRDWLNRAPRAQRALSSHLFVLVPLLVVFAATWHPEFRPYLVVGVTIQNLGIAACIAWTVANPGGWIGKFLNLRPMILVGTMSYSIYLWQQPIINPFSATPLPWLLSLALLAVAAGASYYLIERPAVAWRRRLEARVFRPPSF